MHIAQQLSRQSWLEAAVLKAIPIFQRHGYTVPELRISCGFPSTGIRGSRVGECWPTHISADGVNEIFISPLIDDSVEVIGIILHELVHAVDNCKSGHGTNFKKIATAIGLTGKMIHAYPDEELTVVVRAIVNEIGPYPHKQLKLNRSPRVTESELRLIARNVAAE